MLPDRAKGYEKFRIKIISSTLFYHQERVVRPFELANSSLGETLLFSSVVQGLNDEQIFYLTLGGGKKLI